MPDASNKAFVGFDVVPVTQTVRTMPCSVFSLFVSPSIRVINDHVPSQPIYSRTLPVFFPSCLSNFRSSNAQQRI
jgi:hypothetical protein